MALFSDILLTVDFDRTLTAPDSTIPQRNIDAIEDFMAKGGAFTVNTGRSVPMIAPYADSIPVNAPLLLYNGSAAYDWTKKEFAFAREINLPMWDTIRALIRDFPDLTVEGTFLSGAAVFAILIHHGVNAWIALVASFLVGFLFGTLTGILHVKLRIRPLLCGILVSTALLTVNLIAVSAGMTGDF